MSLINPERSLSIKQKLESFCESQNSSAVLQENDEPATIRADSISKSASLKNIVFDEADELALNLMDLSSKNPVYLNALRECPIPEISPLNVPEETPDIENIEPNRSSSSQMIKVFDDGKYVYYATTIDGLRESMSSSADLAIPPVRSASSATDRKRLINRESNFQKSKTLNEKTLQANQHSNEVEYYNKSAHHIMDNDWIDNTDCDERKKQFADNILVSSNALLTEPFQETVANANAESALRSPHFGSVANAVITTRKFANDSVPLATSTSGGQASVKNLSIKSNLNNITTCRTNITRGKLSLPGLTKSGNKVVTSFTFNKNTPENPVTTYDRVSTTVLKDLSDVQCYKVNPLYAYFLRNNDTTVNTEIN